jgi:hypothetical protein
METRDSKLSLSHTTYGLKQLKEVFMSRFILSIFTVLLLVAVSFSQIIEGNETAQAGGKLLQTGQNDRNLNAMAEWYCTYSLDRGSDAGLCKIDSVYVAAYFLKGIYNNTDSTCHFAYTCYNTTGHIDTVRVGSLSYFGVLPKIHTIVRAATTGKWTLFFQYGAKQ